MRFFLFILPCLLCACSVPIAAGLDDAEANRVVVALGRQSVDANKEVDPAAEGRWRVTVAHDDVAHALALMQGEELPRRDPPGVLDAVGKGSLVPSEAAEHAQLVAGLAGDLQKSLEGVDGVLRARVHLNVPAPSPLRDTAPPRGTASVLLEHRGSTPPVSADAVQRLVAGGVAGLLPTDVSVVMVSRTAPPASGAGEMTHVGPIAVARGSMHALQLVLVVLVALIAALSAATLFFHSRLTRARAQQASPTQAPPPRG